VAAVHNDPNGPLSTLSIDDVAVQEPEITTVISYTVVMPDEGSAEAAAMTLADDAAVVQGVSTAVPGVAASPNQPAPRVAIHAADVKSEVVQEGEDNHLVAMLLFGVLVAVVGAGAAGVVFFQQRQLPDADRKPVSNPLFSDPELAPDSGKNSVSTGVPTFANPMMNSEAISSSDEDISDDEEPSDAVEVPVRYRALAAGIIRSGVDLESDKVGSLIAGEELVALATVATGHTTRIQIDRGWVSVFSKTGKTVLEQIDESAVPTQAEELVDPTDVEFKDPTA
jgi:hypothetical protein